jgi:DNA-3-methyladenine glycosylase
VPRLERDFYARATLDVARGLLGQRLVRILSGQRLSGWIAETEAYIGQADLACHARFGRTPRSEVMFGAPGHAYVYFTYGMHWMLNFVTEVEGFPAAVLIRAILPAEGIAAMRERRQRVEAEHKLTGGPAKLAQALGIDRALNGHDLCAPAAALFVEQAPAVPDALVRTGPRVGLNNTPEPWKSVPWNFTWQRPQPKKPVARPGQPLD